MEFIRFDSVFIYNMYYYINMKILKQWKAICVLQRVHCGTEHVYLVTNHLPRRPLFYISVIFSHFSAK